MHFHNPAHAKPNKWHGIPIRFLKVLFHWCIGEAEIRPETGSPPAERTIRYQNAGTGQTFCLRFVNSLAGRKLAVMEIVRWRQTEGIAFDWQDATLMTEMIEQNIAELHVPGIAAVQKTVRPQPSG